MPPTLLLELATTSQLVVLLLARRVPMFPPPCVAGPEELLASVWVDPSLASATTLLRCVSQT